MTVDEAKKWVRGAADSIEQDRCCGEEEVVSLKAEAKEVCDLLDNCTMWEDKYESLLSAVGGVWPG